MDSQAENKVSPIEIIMTGLIAGLIIELAAFIMREGHYKYIIEFAKIHPGFAVAAFSAAAGLLFMYGQSIKNLIGSFYKQS
jgi:hypothetical protein